MLIWKEVIRPDQYFYDGPDGKPKKLLVTDAAVDHFLKSGQDMLAAGLSIPVPLEHGLPDPPSPLTAAEKAAKQVLNNAGWIKKYAKAQGVKDVPDGALMALVDVADPEIAKKLPTTIKWCSPYINPKFTDGNGKTWENVITHVALTLRPRVTKQAPFTAPAGLSLAPVSLIDPGQKLEGAVAPSRSRLLKRDGGEWKIENPVLFALEDIKEEEVKVDDTPEKEPEMVDNDGNIDGIQMLSHALEILGLPPLPEGCTPENIVNKLLTMLLEHAKTKNGDGGAITPEPPKTEEQPMFMSLTDIEKTKDPLAKSLAKKVLTEAKAARDKRVEALCKRIPKQGFRDKILQAAQAAPLSLGPDGSIHDGLAMQLEILEDGIRDIPALLSNGAAAKEMAQPDGLVMSEERRASVIDEQTKNAGLKKPA